MRVRVDASDVERAAALAKLVRDAGHEVVLDAPDVVLANAASAPVTAGVPVIMLGASDEGAAAVVPEGVSPAVLDAVLRVVTEGLIVRPAGEPGGFASAEEASSVLTAREAEVLAAVGAGTEQQGGGTAAGHLGAHGEVSPGTGVPEAGCGQPGGGRREGITAWSNRGVRIPLLRLVSNRHRLDKPTHIR